MIPDLTGGLGLAVLLVAAGLGFVLDLPGGPAGWREAGPRRAVLLGVTAAVVGVALLASWFRLHP
jgi:hypothetical protein